MILIVFQTKSRSAGAGRFTIDNNKKYHRKYGREGSCADSGGVFA